MAPFFSLPIVYSLPTAASSQQGDSGQAHRYSLNSY